MKIELKPRYGNEKSYYGKAEIEDLGNNRYILYSYGTPVAESNNGMPILYGKWSQTTSRHQKEFLKQLTGISDDEFKQLQKQVKEKR